jgi:hypothetical protein
VARTDDSTGGDLRDHRTFPEGGNKAARHGIPQLLVSPNAPEGTRTFTGYSPTKALNQSLRLTPISIFLTDTSIRYTVSMYGTPST